MKAITLGQFMKAQRGSSTLSLTSALERCGWSAPVGGHFTAGKEIIVLEAWCASGQVWGVGGRENFASTGIRSPDCSARKGSLNRLRYPKSQ
jgi:hypothetical protein